MINETLRRGFMGDAARARKSAYQTLSGAVLLIEGAIAVALILSPLGVSRLMGLGDNAGTEWPRIAGVLLLALVCQMLPGRLMPSASKLTNIIGFVTRAVLGLVLITEGGPFLLLGVLWVAAAVVLAAVYFRYFEAEVMNRP